MSVATVSCSSSYLLITVPCLWIVSRVYSPEIADRADLVCLARLLEYSLIFFTGNVLAPGVVTTVNVSSSAPYSFTYTTKSPPVSCPVWVLLLLLLLLFTNHSRIADGTMPERGSVGHSMGGVAQCSTHSHSHTRQYYINVGWCVFHSDH